MSDFIDSFYDNYLDFKPDWQGTPCPGHARYFAAVPPLAALGRGARVLEIGFGDGQLLRWCKARDVAVTGVEIVPALVERAQALGIDCLRGPLGPATLGERRFDLIVAFDVLEHMSYADILAFFEHSRPHLLDGGRYLVRVPNGASPFGCNYQASDITHRSLLSLGIMKQLARRAGLAIGSVIEPRPYPPGLLARMQRRLGYALQDAISYLLTRAYYGGRAHLQPNLLLTLETGPSAPAQKRGGA